MYSGGNPYQRAVSSGINTSPSVGANTETTAPINQFTGKSDAFKSVTGLGLQRREDPAAQALGTDYMPGFGQASGVVLHGPVGLYGLLQQNRGNEELKQAISGNDKRLSGAARALNIGNNAVLTGGLSLIGFL
jgi:hypothetical protein